MPDHRVMARKKRFVLRSQDKLKGLWFSQGKEPLTLTYQYANEVQGNPDYLERIEVAVENFNRLGLAYLIYSPIQMGIHRKSNALDRKQLQEKYKNAIIFKQSPADAGIADFCRAGFHLLYLYYDLYIGNIETDNIKLPPFAQIVCNPGHRYFSHLGSGVLLHEINHLFGVQHTHILKDTDGILNINISKPDFFSIPKGQYGKFINLYSYESPISQAAHYTPLSLFSIQHYPAKNLAPYRTINKTRIAEILESYRFSDELKEDYFYLLEKYAGYPHWFTYQDITALATAVYTIAPDSMMGRSFNLPYYHLITGIYRPQQDEKKMIRLIKAFQHAENFSYPIFAQENMTITTDSYRFFSKSLIKHLKIVKLNNRKLTCSFKESVNISTTLLLNPECMLTSQSEPVGRFTFNIYIDDQVTRIERTIRLDVSPKKMTKDKILLGKREGDHLFYVNTSVDLIDLCQAVALPIDRKLRCAIDDLPQGVGVDNCQIKLFEQKTFTLAIHFLNGGANKTCYMQFIALENLTLTEPLTNSAEGISNLTMFLFNNSNGSAYYIQEIPSLINHTKHLSTVTTKISYGYIEKFNYLVTIPFFQGIFEGLVNTRHIHPGLKVSLHLIPRIALVYFGYSSILGFSLVCLFSFFEGLLRTGFRKSACLEKYITILTFLAATELEYSFSNLWILIGRIEFWPALTDKLNSVIVQSCFAPAIKMLGYLGGMQLGNYCSPDPTEDKDRVKVEPLLSQNLDVYNNDKQSSRQPCFFSALKVAANTVFSRKIMTLCPFFSRQASPSQQEEPLTLIAEAGVCL